MCEEYIKKHEPFKHLTESDRVRIETMNDQKCSVKEIADYIGCGLATVYRELKRGKTQRMLTDLRIVDTYSSDLAQQDYKYKATAKGAQLKIGKDFKLVEHIENKIANEHYSPKAVLGEIKTKKLHFDTTISYTTLYRYIYDGLFLHLTMKNLPEGKRETKTYQKVNRVSHKKPLNQSIESRAESINKRESFGHWEMDTVIGKKKGGGNCLLVLSERLTRNEIVIKMRAKTTDCVVKALNALQRKLGSAFSKVFKTITVDNGSEFMDCKGMESRQRTKIFYCHPYSSWERGTNENINKMIRRFIPKGTKIETFTHKQIQYIQNWINNYPRAMHNYQSSNDLFQQQLQSLGINGFFSLKY